LGTVKPSALALLATLLLVATVNSGDFENKPVEFRINLALDRVSTYTDTIARSASAAHPVASSVNPASDDYLRDPPFDFSAVATLGSNVVGFNSGAWVSGHSATGLYRLRDAGTISGTFVRTDSYNALSRQNTDFSLRSNQLILGYSQAIDKNDKKYAYGASARLTQGDLNKDDELFGFARKVDTNSLGGDFRLGVLLPVTDNLLLGLLGGAGWTHSKIEGSVQFPPPPFGPGPVGTRQSITTRMRDVRAGLGWQPSRNIGLYVDAQYVHLHNKFATFDVGRAYLGAEYFPMPALALRLGAAMDTEVQGTFSTGLGYYLIPNVPLELAYSYNAFPEVRREFGRANLLSLSIAFTF
jgi:hypothetical protein